MEDSKILKGEDNMGKKCPNCNSSRWNGRICKKCGFVNDPEYLRRKDGRRSRDERKN